MKEVVLVARMEEADLGLKRPATLPLTITDKVLMVMGEVYMGYRILVLCVERSKNSSF